MALWTLILIFSVRTFPLDSVKQDTGHMTFIFYSLCLSFFFPTEVIKREHILLLH